MIDLLVLLINSSLLGERKRSGPSARADSLRTFPSAVRERGIYDRGEAHLIYDAQYPLPQWDAVMPARIRPDLCQIIRSGGFRVRRGVATGRRC